MKNANKRFLQILAVELDDLYEDIECMIGICSERNKIGIQSERVFQENEAVLKNELLGIQNFRDLVNGTDPACFQSVDELISHLRREFSCFVDSGDIVPATRIYLNRKIEKVANYILPSRQEMQRILQIV